MNLCKKSVYANSPVKFHLIYAKSPFMHTVRVKFNLIYAKSPFMHKVRSNEFPIYAKKSVIIKTGHALSHIVQERL